MSSLIYLFDNQSNFTFDVYEGVTTILELEVRCMTLFAIGKSTQVLRVARSFNYIQSTFTIFFA